MSMEEAITGAYREAVIAAINSEAKATAHLAPDGIPPTVVTTALLVTACEFVIENCKRPGATVKASTVVSQMIDQLREVAVMLAVEGE